LVLLCLRRGSNQWSVVSGIILALAFTAGHPQTFLHISYVAAAYYFFLQWQRGWAWRRVLGQGVVIGGVALGASAVMWLPALQFVPLTVRAEAGYDFVSTGQTAVNYLQAWFPSALTFWTPEYIGLTAIFLAVFALVGRTKLTTPEDPLRQEILFWALLVLVAAWLSLGDKGILWEAWYYVAPGFQLFRQQERLVGVVSFGLALLAGLGMALWWRPSKHTADERRILLKHTALITAVPLLFLPIFLLVAEHIVPRPWVGRYLLQLLWFALTLLLLWPWKRAGKKPFAIPLLLLALLTVDLWLGTAVSVNRTPEPPSAIWPQPEWLTLLQNEPERGRVDPGFLYFVNFGEAFDMQSVRGISPLKPQLLDDFERNLPLSRLWPLLNVTHGLFEGGLPSDLVGTPLAEATESVIPGEVREAVLYRYDAPQPKAWLSTNPVVVPDRAAALAALGSPEVDVRQQVVVTEDTAVNYAVQPSDQPLPLPTVTQIHPGRLSIEVTTAVDAYLVISEWALPGWHATLNGQDTPLLTLNYGLQGLFVPAGTHEVVLWFRPWRVVVGGLVTGLTLLLVGGWLFWQKFFQKR
ncbi:MAG: YfhO family protein, partial [Anaerolineales bacterium]|nr:YfhO family protein [Anaerolineales bacterium]